MNHSVNELVQEIAANTLSLNINLAKIKDSSGPKINEDRVCLDNLIVLGRSISDKLKQLEKLNNPVLPEQPPGKIISSKNLFS